MDPDFKKLRYEYAYSGIKKKYGAVRGIENCEIQHSSQEVWVTTKFLCPFFKLNGPFRLIFFKSILSVKKKLKLIVAVESKPENSHEGKVKFFKMPEVIALMRLNFDNCLISDSKWIAFQEILNLNVIYKMPEKGLFQR